MEHVSRIWLWIKELERITKPGGKIILISPISWPYHEAPIDCWRIYPEGMKALINDFTNLNILLCNQETLEHLFLKTDKIIPEIIMGLDTEPHLHVRRKLFFNRICKFLIKIHSHFNNPIIPIGGGLAIIYAYCKASVRVTNHTIR